MRLSALLLVAGIAGVAASVSAQAPRKTITLDEFFSASEITAARLAPDGTAAIIEVESSDWQENRFHKDLSLWTAKSNAVTPLTHSGHDFAPQWSPDGRTLAFLSDRPLPGADPAETKDKDDQPTRLWILPLAAGGEAYPLYREPLDVHAFAWSADSGALIFATAQALSKNAQDAHKEEWKDVVRWREQERGDVLLALPLSAAIVAIPAAHAEPTPSADKPAYPAGSRIVATCPLGIGELTLSPAGDQFAFETTSVSHRLENPADAEIFLVPFAGGTARQITHNQGLESQLTFTPDGRALDFLVQAAGGSVEGPYQDVQGRLYSLDLASAAITRLGTSFPGSFESLALTPEGKLLATGNTGINTALYQVDGPAARPIAQIPGNYGHLATARASAAVLFTHSTITEPAQAYLAVNPAAQPRQLTAFNPVFSQRAQSTWKPYRWTAPDGATVEGVLIYPPGKQAARGLRMLTLIHGGPADSDGNKFGADWYDWATFAAANNWLVFRPNYRGSTGYGDKFQLGIMPHLVSVPGLDILAGVDALVKDGVADPGHLAIGGYSYGGYMTNWLITQTTRFKSAVTGAGAVEHAANWGNDDLTFDDAWYLSGTPWQKPELYQSEAALFQMNKVTTPTHLVGGDQDNRVSYFEDVLLERALQSLKVPHQFLVFPGENHPLDKNPWHGYIKVREELKWLNRYDQP